MVMRLPVAGGGWLDYLPRGAYRHGQGAPPARSRVAYAAVHVVADPLADAHPGAPAAVDWEATLAYRRHVWSFGLGVAEAMDTAQRGMGLDWAASRELIARSLGESRAVGGRIVCGAQTDQLAPGSARSLRDVEAAYEEQCEFVESRGGRVVLMPSRELARIATCAEDYARVYGRLLGQLSRPALIHWLGEVFDPQLAVYWGFRDVERAMACLLDIVAANPGRVEGVKISLLDQRREIEMRRRLPEGVRMFTGDDFDYPTTILGDGERHSDALLGIFDAIAPAAAAALAALDGGDADGFGSALTPTLPLARHVFSAPTQYYKTGVVFLAYLNGHQDHFRMVGGLESGRSIVHLARILVLADEAGLLRDPELAAARIRPLLALAGVPG